LFHKVAPLAFVAIGKGLELFHLAFLVRCRSLAKLIFHLSRRLWLASVLFHRDLFGDCESLGCE
jgi:hypothetical protein